MSNLELLKTSWSYQTKEFFQKSTLHGVRYIREEGRPFLERFMWFCFTSIGGVATLIIIVSLWEKFQTNPTITGLDTDFHNWNVPFPGVTFCARNPVNMKKVSEYVDDTWKDKDDATKQNYRDVIALIANISIENLEQFANIQIIPEIDSPAKFREISSKVLYTCSEVFEKCIFKMQDLKPCEEILPLQTENGYCFAFNSRHAYIRNHGKDSKSFVRKEIYETDVNLDLIVNIFTNENLTNTDYTHMPMRVYIQSPDAMPVVDISPQHVWNYLIKKIQFSSKETYTIPDARQLSIRQRRCVFDDEIHLSTDTIYTYTACMSQCRMNHAKQLCGCIPHVYLETKDYPLCNMEGLKCLGKNAESLQRSIKCSCYLGCSHTVYEVEKLHSGNVLNSSRADLEIGFVSWPMIRYKREVLFGWVDLLVSFGGIAGLFLGFSLLSGVEVIYYFTMRACCMVYRDADELRQLKQEYETAEKPPIDLSLTPSFMKKQNIKQRRSNGIFSIGALPPSDFQYLP